jgi:hypothetical protein
MLQSDLEKSNLFTRLVALADADPLGSWWVNFRIITNVGTLTGRRCERTVRLFLR